jgi:CheY-like chemotaxis protein
VLQPRVVLLDHVLAGIQRMVVRLMGEDVQVAMVVPAGIDPVLVDPGQIEQIVLNLAVNARDAMPSGGRLTVELANVVLDPGHPAGSGARVMLAVIDTGVGMTPDVQARIFEPFFTTKAKGKGTGLGLSTVHGIVTQSGGTIWVYSEPGRGTTFKIYFTPVEGDVRSTTAAPVEPAVRGVGTILLVEDDDQLRQLARTILKRNGYEVVDAKSGGDALVMAEKLGAKIDLLLTDVVMPLMSGRELAERLLQQRPGLRVLYMSGYTDDAVVRHGMLEANVAFLQKPITPGALLRRVRDVLR